MVEGQPEGRGFTRGTPGGTWRVPPPEGHFQGQSMALALALPQLNEILAQLNIYHPTIKFSYNHAKLTFLMALLLYCLLDYCQDLLFFFHTLF